MNIFIHGSCVTRDAFGFDTSDIFKIEHYSARSSLATLALPPISEGLDLSKLQSSFQKRMLKYDHDRAVIEHLSSKNYDIVILDFIDERGGLVNLDNKGFVTNLSELRNSGAINNAISVKYIKEYSPEHKTLFLAGFNKFLSSVKDNTPVFINKVFWATQNELGVQIGTNSKYIYEANKFLTDIYETLESQYPDVKFIKYNESLFVANSNHKWGQLPFHYVDELYYSLLAQLNDENIKMNKAKSNTYFYNLKTWKYPVNDHILDNIDNINVSDWMKNDVIHRVFLNSTMSIDFCIAGTEFYHNSKSILVCFSGAVTGDRENKPAPILSGFKISSNVKMPLISIADPSMALSKDINIGWYAGNKEIPNLLQIIAKVLDKIFQKTLKKQILFGGSGGGFASLAVAQFVENPVSVCVANPQTRIGDYIEKYVKKYLVTAYNIDKKKYNYEIFGKNDIEYSLNQYVIHHDLNKGKFHKDTKIIYLQNLSDLHTTVHAVPFFKKYAMKKLGHSIFISPISNIGLYIGNWGSGHAPVKEDLLNKVIELLDNDKKIPEVLSFLDSINDVKLPNDLITKISPQDVNLDFIDTEIDLDITFDKKYNLHRSDASSNSELLIEITFASDENVGKFELLHNIDYFNEVNDHDILKMNYSRSPIKEIGFFKYISTTANTVYKRNICISFPVGAYSASFLVKQFYPKGKSFIIKSVIKPLKSA